MQCHAGEHRGHEPENRGEPGDDGGHRGAWTEPDETPSDAEEGRAKDQGRVEAASAWEGRNHRPERVACGPVIRR